MTSRLIFFSFFFSFLFLQSELILPLQDYKDFVKVFLNEDLVAVRVLYDTTDDRERVTQLVVRVWHAMHCALNNLRRLVVSEIDATGLLPPPPPLPFFVELRC